MLFLPILSILELLFRKRICQPPHSALPLCSVMSNSWQPHGLQSARLLCPWDSPGKNTRVGCHALLQGIFPSQGSNLHLLHCRQVLYPLSHLGSPPAPLGHKHKLLQFRVLSTEGLWSCLLKIWDTSTYTISQVLFFILFSYLF